ncbi:unnamed protein product [Arabis nemorensis]|uniref:Carboxypeptidase n=1 Tax=Arabis nemorensis TaxID=586526 RepID=A0A565BC38_9BRAS|nr:unnamed protein product [Arabis nemorensis]
MEKQQNWSLIACVFLFLSLASQIQCTSQSHSNAIRRINGPSFRTTVSRVNQQKLKKKDLIKRLPGQPSVKFRQYGGYVAVNESAGQFLYYYFVESIKTNDSSPLVIWFNGGPGCSSLTSAFQSHGPFRIHSDGKTLYHNPYSWNNANMLYVEAPVQVGFSYTNTPFTYFDSQGDSLTAEDNYIFLVKWLERFPEYKGREFYIAAQSYGGHYGPQLAQLILHRKTQTFINLRGMILGNPAFDNEIDSKGNDEYLVGHAYITKELLAHKNQICGSTIKINVFSECGKADAKISMLTRQLDLYNIYAHVCLNSTVTSKPKKYTTVIEFDPCSTHYMTAYLNRENVQKAMHANTTKLSYPWRQCMDNTGMYYNSTDLDVSMLPTLHELMGKGIRILVYSGDLDAMVSVTSTMHVLEKLNLTVEKTWRPWFSGREMGGYTEEYKGNFTYATVRGAGHSVPSDQPIRALTLFTSFIRNTPLPHL